MTAVQDSASAQLGAAAVFKSSYGSYQALYTGSHSAFVTSLLPWLLLSKTRQDNRAFLTSLLPWLLLSYIRQDLRAGSAGNYIGHRAAYEAIKPFLQGRTDSFTLLDLG